MLSILQRKSRFKTLCDRLWYEEGMKSTLFNTVLFIGSGLITLLLFSSTVLALPTSRENRPMIYLDLGNVLIDTNDPTQLRYVPGAELYLQTLLRSGYPLALITNIPEAWGKTYEEKLQALKNYVLKLWREPQAFPWQIFDRILLPPTDQLRKPHPYLFQQALSYPDFCQPFYQGEDPTEVNVAASLGMGSYLIPVEPNSPRPKFAPLQILVCRPHSARGY